MKARKSKAIVVDASIARSAGMTEYPASLRCRETLQTMLHYCHRVVITEAVAQEWRTHASRFARGWLASMKAKKKLMQVTDAATYTELLEQLEACIDTPRQREAVSKDFHLVVAALATDKIVITRDKELGKILHDAASEVRTLRSIVFANPEVAEDEIVAWLNRGAPAENSRCLGYKPRKQD